MTIEIGLLTVFLIDASLCLVSLLIVLAGVFRGFIECNIVENASNSYRIGQGA